MIPIGLLQRWWCNFIGPLWKLDPFSFLLHTSQNEANDQNIGHRNQYILFNTNDKVEKKDSFE